MDVTALRYNSMGRCDVSRRITATERQLQGTGGVEGWEESIV